MYENEDCVSINSSRLATSLPLETLTISIIILLQPRFGIPSQATATSITQHTTNENAGVVKYTWKLHRIDSNRKGNPYKDHTLMCHMFFLLTIQHQRWMFESDFLLFYIICFTAAILIFWRETVDRLSGSRYFRIECGQVYHPANLYAFIRKCTAHSLIRAIIINYVKRNRH